MRIGVIAHAKFPINEPFAGGLEAHTYELCRGLRRRGHEVVLYARQGSSGPASTLYPLRLAGERGDFVELQQAYLEAVDHVCSEPLDVLHLNSLHYLPVLMAPRLPCPVTMTLHTPAFNELASGVVIERHAAAIRYVSVSNHTARIWQPLIGDSAVILNGIDLSKWPFCPSPPRRQTVALWSGRICPEKAPHLAIEAAVRAGLELWLCGPVYDQEYHRQQVVPRLSSRVRYLGHKTQGELSGLLGQAAVCLFSSVWDEPFGLTVIEALACGTPVAAFAGGAIPELLDRHCGRTARLGAVDELATAALAAAGLDRRACRRRAEQRFSLTRMVDQYEALFHDCLRTQTRAA